MGMDRGEGGNLFLETDGRDEVISVVEIPRAPWCASVFAICNRREDVSEYCWVLVVCFLFGAEGLLFVGNG
jgi:hypothetical protein